VVESSKLAPAEAGIASWQVSGRIVERCLSFGGCEEGARLTREKGILIGGQSGNARAAAGRLGNGQG